MTIANHQIDTVLRTYHRQLRFERINQRAENKRDQHTDDFVTISPEGRKRQLAYEPVEIQEKQNQSAETSPSEEEN